MKTLLSIVFILFLSLNTQAQIWKKVQKAAQRGVERTVEKKVENKTSEKTDEVLDKVLEPQSKKKSDSKSETTTEQAPNSQSNTTIGGTLSVSEVKGQIIFVDNFAKTPLGDFPTGFTSSSGGAVTEINGNRGLLFNPNSNILIQTKELPINFALEFDLTLQNVPPSLYNTYFNIYFQELKNLKHNDPKNKFGAVGFNLWGAADDEDLDLFNFHATYEIKEEIPFTRNKDIIENTSRFTILVNGNRLQWFINGKKIADSPNLLEGVKANYINFRLNGTKKEKNQRFIISNVKITKIEEDLRSQMMEGQFSTNEILFASNSTTIEKSSFHILNEIGSVMQDNPQTMFLIVGHTDSDGSTSTNQSLSEKRAAAVRQYLLANFKIKSNNLRTIGKGESDPVASNNTAEGKAQNRRVEFIKE
ncbi:MAG: OmpA family protein [Bacteroidetes bacterium]|nr:OmpA family protein [Bacteroidota bacterium]